MEHGPYQVHVLSARRGKEACPRPARLRWEAGGGTRPALLGSICLTGKITGNRLARESRRIMTEGTRKRPRFGTAKPAARCCTGVQGGKDPDNESTMSND